MEGGRDRVEGVYEGPGGFGFGTISRKCAHTNTRTWTHSQKERKDTGERV